MKTIFYIFMKLHCISISDESVQMLYTTKLKTINKTAHTESIPYCYPPFNVNFHSIYTYTAYIV